LERGEFLEMLAVNKITYAAGNQERGERGMMIEPADVIGGWFVLIGEVESSSDFEWPTDIFHNEDAIAVFPSKDVEGRVIAEIVGMRRGFRIKEEGNDKIILEVDIEEDTVVLAAEKDKVYEILGIGGDIIRFNIKEGVGQ
jgi:hypothetical protein